jgi:hypothetical protein
LCPRSLLKRGVYKTLQIKKEHLESLYPRSKGADFFLYDSSKLGQVRDFATSPNIRIMVVTVGAINKMDRTREKAKLPLFYPDLEAHCKPKARMAICRDGEAQDHLDFEETRSGRSG